MEVGSDASATKAMVQATILAEKAHEGSKVSARWQALVDDMIVKLARLEKAVPPSSLPYQNAFRKREPFVKEVRMNEHASYYNKAKNPVKTSFPPQDISLDSSHLSERIDSLQNLALVGRWHFLEMDDVAMRKWFDH